MIVMSFSITQKPIQRNGRLEMLPAPEIQAKESEQIAAWQNSRVEGHSKLISRAKSLPRRECARLMSGGYLEECAFKVPKLMPDLSAIS